MQSWVCTFRAQEHCKFWGMIVPYGLPFHFPPWLCVQKEIIIEKQVTVPKFEEKEKVVNVQRTYEIEIEAAKPQGLCLGQGWGWPRGCSAQDGQGDEGNVSFGWGKRKR